MTLEIEYVPLDDLKAAPHNPRQISDDEMDKLKTSISEFGFVKPVLVNTTTGNIIAGHQRVVAARALGMTDCPVVYTALSESREKALNIALNKISGEWDIPMLKDILTEIDTGEFEIEVTGFDNVEIEMLMTQTYQPPNEAEIDENIETDHECPKCGYEW